MTGEEAAAVKRDGWDPLWGCLSSETGASQHVLRWDPQDRLDETQGSRQEGSMTPSEFLSVSIHKLVEETGARSQRPGFSLQLCHFQPVNCSFLAPQMG